MRFTKQSSAEGYGGHKLQIRTTGISPLDKRPCMATSSVARQSLLKGLVLSLLLTSARANTSAGSAAAITPPLQDSIAGTRPASIRVPADAMEDRCVTKVSPLYPYATADVSRAESVVLQAVISKSGHVLPIGLISGNGRLQNEAMNAVRLWRYKPYVHNGEPVDVTTEIVVHFTPGRPGGVVTHPRS